MSAFKTLVSAAALGAAAMYVLDPDRGRRRRAVARDKARRFVNRGSDLVDAARRDTAHRLRALGARARQLTERQGIPSDEVLVERVRARMGRVIAHPHAVHVAADHGLVRLSGPILRREHLPLIAGVRSVRGVREVDDEGLALYDRAEGVSALQGNRRRGGARSEILQDNWTPALRVGAIAGGGILVLYAQRRGALTRLVLTTTGVALVARGAANKPLAGMLRIERQQDEAFEQQGSGVLAGTDDWSAAEPVAARQAQPGL
jgi:hypothetical protein